MGLSLTIHVRPNTDIDVRPISGAWFIELSGSEVSVDIHWLNRDDLQRLHAAIGEALARDAG